MDSTRTGSSYIIIYSKPTKDRNHEDVERGENTEFERKRFKKQESPFILRKKKIFLYFLQKFFQKIVKKREIMLDKSLYIEYNVGA